MKIRYDYGAFCRQPYGGYTRYFSTLCKVLVEKYSVDAAIVPFFHINGYLRDERVRTLGAVWLPKFKGATRLLPLIDDVMFRAYGLAAKPDIIHETYPAYYPPSNRARHYVCTVHDMTHELFPAYSLSSDMPKRKQAMLRRASAIIAISENTKRDLIKYTGMPSDRIHVIHHGVSAFPKKPYSIPYAAPYILFVGQRDLYKNFDTLLKAYVNSPELRREFHLIAFGGGKFTEAEVVRLNKLGIARSVQQRSGGDELLNAYYAHAAAFVFPSLYEGFGLPLLEAMAAGCPVLCSNVSCFPEVAADAALFFDPSDAEALTSQLGIVLFSETTRAELISRGRDRATQFSWEKCASKTLAVYRSLLA